MGSGCVLTKIVVMPKNSIMEAERANTAFYNIDTSESHDNSYNFKPCDWIEEIDDEYVVFHNDVMMVEYVDDLSDVVDEKHMGIAEYINDEPCHGEMLECYETLWQEVCHLFKEDLLKRDKDEISKKFIMYIVMEYYHDSYLGDGDMNMYIEDVWQLPSSGKMDSVKALNEPKGNPRFDIPEMFR